MGITYTVQYEPKGAGIRRERDAATLAEAVAAVEAFAADALGTPFSSVTRKAIARRRWASVAATLASGDIDTANRIAAVIGVKVVTA